MKKLSCFKFVPKESPFRKNLEISARNSIKQRKSETLKTSTCYFILYYYILSISGVAGLYRDIINRFIFSPVYPFLPLPTSVS